MAREVFELTSVAIPELERLIKRFDENSSIRKAFINKFFLAVQNKKMPELERIYTSDKQLFYAILGDLESIHKETRERLSKFLYVEEIREALKLIEVEIVILRHVEKNFFKQKFDKIDLNDLRTQLSTLYNFVNKSEKEDIMTLSRKIKQISA